MKLLNVNDTNFNSVQAKNLKKIIYSVSWHPTEKKVAMSTVNGNLIIYEALKNKQVGHITPVPETQSFCVAWNQRDPRYLCLTSAIGKAFVIEAQDATYK